jgi:predicted Zn-dependent protease
MLSNHFTRSRTVMTVIYWLTVSCLSIAFPVAAQTPTSGDYFDPSNHQLLSNLKKNHLAPALRELDRNALHEAQSDVDFILKYVPNHVEALALNEAIAKARNLPEQALLRYATALELYPEHAITHVQFGAYLLDLGRVQAAIDSLNAAVKLDPELGLAHSYLAKAYRRTGDTQRAAAEEAEAQRYSGRGGGR